MIALAVSNAALQYQSVHAPAQAPQAYIDMFNASLPGPEYKQRRTFAGMVHCFDEGLGNVTAALQAKGMLDDTLIVFTTGERDEWMD